MSNLSHRTLLLSAAAIIAIIVLFLVVQDQRHGWPFSRHMARPSTEHASSHPSGAARSAATRAPIEIPAQQIEALGVRFEPVEVRPLVNPVRAVATVVADESRISHVHTRVAGWLEDLYVNTTGQKVRAGQPIAAVFSQEPRALAATDAALAGYASGQGTLVSVIESARALWEVQAEQVMADSALGEAWARLERSIGETQEVRR